MRRATGDQREGIENGDRTKGMVRAALMLLRPCPDLM